MSQEVITVYTDGSCNTIHKTGGWAAIFLMNGNKIVLKGTEKDTTNQRMELTAVLKALEFVQLNLGLGHLVNVCTDSQYVVDIEKRMARLQTNKYRTKQGNPNRNEDLVRSLVRYINHMSITFTKVVAHQKEDETENLNREVDKLARRIVREQRRLEGGRLED